MFTVDPRRSTPWVWLTIAGLACLSLVDVWREAPNACCDWVRGSAPNLLATPILTFAIVSYVYPRHQSHSAVLQRNQRRWFFGALGIAVAGLISWEFIQRTGGRLVYDPLDIAATLVGAALSAALFFGLQRFSWRRITDATS